MVAPATDITTPEFRSLKEIGTGFCHAEIPDAHGVKLIGMGLAYLLLGELRITTAGRAAEARELSNDVGPSHRSCYDNCMHEINWYADATLVSETGHVYCAGTLAQCLRRWTRLSEADRKVPVIKTGRDGMPPSILNTDDIAALASNPGLFKA